MDIKDILRKEYGIKVSHTVVAGTLEKLGYSKQMNQKMLQAGKPHPNRNAPFEYLNATSKEYIKFGIPVISIDCKKKTLEISKIPDRNTGLPKIQERFWIMIF